MFRKRALLVISLILILLTAGLVPAASQEKTELTIGFSFVIVDSLDPGVTTSSGCCRTACGAAS